MEEISLREGDEFIKLGQLLKKANMMSSGVDAKMVILDGLVSVNGEVELRRGKNYIQAMWLLLKERALK